MTTTDLEIAKNAVNGHSIALVKNGETIVSDKRGIAPLVDYLSEGKTFAGFSAADLIVGKAAAMLFVKAGVKSVFAKVISSAGKTYLEKHNVDVSFGEITEKIMNRTKTDVCPMEKTVKNTDDFEQGFIALKNKLEELRNNKN